jgi:predicted DCC family thiol-disulfide oxidoreductase YuxK
MSWSSRTRLQDWIYRRVARNRYRFFGSTDVCAVLPEEFRSRFLR